LNESIGIAWIGLIFLVAHFIDDWYIQVFFKRLFAKLNIGCSKENWKWLSFHCLCYVVGFVPVFWWLRINLLWLILLFGSHYLIDGLLRSRKDVDTYYPLSRFLRDVVKYAALGKTEPIQAAFIRAKFQIIDQLLHFLVLGLILLVISF